MISAGVIALPSGLGAALLAEARAAGGCELCGFIAASGDRLWVRYAVANRAAYPSDRFDMDPGDQIAAFKQMREAGQTLVAIYHSHPRGEAEPSDHDRQGHSYPDAAALIVAPHANREPIRAWQLDEASATEIAIDWIQAH